MATKQTKTIKATSAHERAMFQVRAGAYRYASATQDMIDIVKAAKVAKTDEAGLQEMRREFIIGYVARSFALKSKTNDPDITSLWASKAENFLKGNSTHKTVKSASRMWDRIKLSAGYEKNTNKARNGAQNGNAKPDDAPAQAAAPAAAPAAAETVKPEQPEAREPATPAEFVATLHNVAAQAMALLDSHKDDPTWAALTKDLPRYLAFLKGYSVEQPNAKPRRSAGR